MTAMLSKSFDGSSLLNVSAILQNHSGDNFGFVQFWYGGIEQAFCELDGCTVGDDHTELSTTWNCGSMSCKCIPGTAFCGAGVRLFHY